MQHLNKLKTIFCLKFRFYLVVYLEAENVYLEAENVQLEAENVYVEAKNVYLEAERVNLEAENVSWIQTIFNCRQKNV